METYPLTAAERLHLVTLQNACEKQALNICVSLLIHIDVNFDALARAVRKAVERDDSMRLRFTAPGADGGVRQYIVPSDERPVRHEDLTRLTEADAMVELHQWSRRPFEPRWDAPLFEVVTVAMPGGWNGAFVRIDHMLSDSCAMIVFLCDVVELYAAEMFGTAYPAARTPFLASLRRDLERAADPARVSRDLAFWQEQIEKDGEPLYADIRGSGSEYREPGRRWGRGETRDLTAGQRTFILEPAPAERLLEFCEEQNISMTNLLLMALRTYLSKQNGGQADITIRSYVSRRVSRTDRKAGGTRIHYFPCRTILPLETRFIDGVRAVAAVQNQIFRHTDFDTLEVERLRRERWGAPENALYESVGLTYQPFPMRMQDERLNQIEYRSHWHDSGVQMQPLYLTVMHRPLGAGMDFYFKYQAARYTGEEVERMYYYLMRILFAAVEDPERTVSEIIGSV